MVPNIPGYIAFIVIATNLTLIVVLWRILSTAAGRSNLSPVEQRTVRIGSALFLGGWLIADLLLAPPPVSLLNRDPYYVTPLIPLLDGVPIAIVLVALWRSSSLRRTIATVTLPNMHAVQVYRAVGAVFLILLAQGQLPAYFALPAGWGDIVVGVAAPFVALALARGVSFARPLAVSWNVLGLIDLVVAVGTGTGLLASLLAGSHVPSAGAMGVFPMILVPTFAVPVSVMLHVIGLVRLSRTERVGMRLAPAAAS
jgi:hypothetical protein